MRYILRKPERILCRVSATSNHPCHGVVFSFFFTRSSKEFFVSLFLLNVTLPAVTTTTFFLRLISLEILKGVAVLCLNLLPFFLRIPVTIYLCVCVQSHCSIWWQIEMVEEGATFSCRQSNSISCMKHLIN